MTEEQKHKNLKLQVESLRIKERILDKVSLRIIISGGIIILVLALLFLR